MARSTKAVVAQHLRRNSFESRIDEIEFNEICSAANAVDDADLPTAERFAASYSADVQGEWTTADARAQRASSTLGAFIAIAMAFLTSNAGISTATTSASASSIAATPVQVFATILFAVGALAFIAASLLALHALRSSPAPIDRPTLFLRAEPSFRSLAHKAVAWTLLRARETWYLSERRTVLVRRAELAFILGFAAVALGAIASIIARIT